MKHYIREIEAATTLNELKNIAHQILLDESLKYPRHILNTYASVYRDQYKKLKNM